MMSKNSSLTLQHRPPLKVHNALRDFLIKMQMADADGSQDEAHCSFVTADQRDPLLLREIVKATLFFLEEPRAWIIYASA